MKTIEDLAWDKAVKRMQGDSVYALGFKEGGNMIADAAIRYILDEIDYIDRHRYNIYADEIINRLRDFVDGEFLHFDEEEQQ